MKVRAAPKAALSPAHLCSSIVAPTKVEEAKAALEQGDFERGLRLIEEAEAEQPNDPGARELYVVTHLARAIRLSDKAREARREDLLRRKIEYDVEFQDSPGVADRRRSSGWTGSVNVVTAEAFAPCAASSDHSSSSTRSVRAVSFPSIHSTRSARPISPQERHSHPSA